MFLCLGFLFFFPMPPLSPFLTLTKKRRFKGNDEERYKYVVLLLKTTEKAQTEGDEKRRLCKQVFSFTHCILQARSFPPALTVHCLWPVALRQTPHCHPQGFLWKASYIARCLCDLIFPRAWLLMTECFLRGGDLPSLSRKMGQMDQVVS